MTIFVSHHPFAFLLMQRIDPESSMSGHTVKRVLKVHHKNQVQTIANGDMPTTLLFVGDSPQNLAAIAQHGFPDPKTSPEHDVFEPLLLSSGIAIADSEYCRLHPDDNRSGAGQDTTNAANSFRSHAVLSWRALLVLTRLGRVAESCIPFEQFIANSTSMITDMIQRGFDSVQFAANEKNGNTFYLTLRDPATMAVPSFLIEYEVTSRLPPS